MDRLAHRVVAAEREAHVRHAARDVRVRQVLADPAGGLDEVDRVVGVLLDAGGDREDVGVEDDVLGREADRFGQELVGARADFGLARVGVGLAGFVEGHHDHRRAVAQAQFRAFDELGLAFLHRDRIDDALALDALEAGLDHAPLRRVDHDRHARDVGLRGDQEQEAHHRRLGVEHALVHVDVDDLRAVFHLLARDRQRVVVAAFEDHAGEGLGAGDVGALADVDEQRVLADVERLQPGQAHRRFEHRRHARRDAFNRFRDGGDVRRRGAAAAADDVQESRARPFADVHRHFRRRPCRIRRRRWAGRRWGGPRRTRRPCWRAPRRTGAAGRGRARSCRPIDSGRAWRTEFQNASPVWPDSVRPEASVMVPEIITGSRRLFVSKYSSIANSAALAFSVSKIVSTIRMSAPPFTRPSIASR